MSVVVVPALAGPDALWTLRSLRRLPGDSEDPARSAVDQPRYQIIEVVEVDFKLFRQIRLEQMSFIIQHVPFFTLRIWILKVLWRVLNWSQRLFVRLQFVQAAVTLRLTWKPSRAFLRNPSQRARSQLQQDHSGVPTGRGNATTWFTCAVTSCFTHRGSLVHPKGEPRGPSTTNARRFSMEKICTRYTWYILIYIYIYIYIYKRIKLTQPTTPIAKFHI